MGASESRAWSAATQASSTFAPGSVSARPIADIQPLLTQVLPPGNARDLVQAIGSAQPTLKYGQLNGRKAVRFCAGKWMATTGLSLALPDTVVIVAILPRTAGTAFSSRT